MRIYENVRCRRGVCGLALLILMFACAHLTAQELDLGHPMGGTEPAKQVNDGPPRMSQERESSQDFFVVGTLETVQNKRTGTTRIALVDDEGQVTAFVAPSTKFDLRDYLGRDIGVTAKTFSQTESGPPYVLVDKITSLSFAPNEKLAELTRPTPAGATLASHWQVETGSSKLPAPSSRVAQVQHEFGECEDCAPIANAVPTEIVSDGEFIDGEFIDGGTYYADDSAAFGGFSQVGETYFGGGYGEACDIDLGAEACECAQCSSGNCCRGGCGGCKTCGPPGWFWIRGEYLLWWAKGFETPPLVTRGSDPVNNAGVLGRQGTQVLFGGDAGDFLDSARHGYRLRFGGWIGPCRKFGYEGEYFSTGSITDSPSFGDINGIDIISRPFFNVGEGLGFPIGEVSEDVSNSASGLAGFVTVDSRSEFMGSAARFRWNMCCKQCDQPCRRCGYPPFSKFDLLAGYRFYDLEESLTITEDLEATLDPTGEITVRDRFATDNTFHGAELGASWEGGVNRWTLDTTMLVAIGGTNQRAALSGETRLDPDGEPARTFVGNGLLVQPSNAGTYERNRFSMIPQMNVNLGYYLTPRLRFIVGYSLIYWSNVVRPGDIIDPVVNTNFLPDYNLPRPTTVDGAARPQFAFRDSDFWAQGLNLGLDLRW